jgi:hypothetical protein
MTITLGVHLRWANFKGPTSGTRRAASNMASSKPKTLHLAELSLVSLLSSGTCYYWTLTTAKNVTSKAEAEAIAKPLWDRIRHLGGKRLHFWERQARGAWHVHFITDLYLDVNELRPWLIERGWGPQMRAERVREENARFDPERGTWSSDNSRYVRLVRYLQKYITKSITDDSGHRVKAFGGSRDAKMGNCQFRWVPWVRPGAYLYYYGAQLYRELYSENPKFFQVGLIVRMGVEATDWLETDPWWMPSG